MDPTTQLESMLKKCESSERPYHADIILLCNAIEDWINDPNTDRKFLEDIVSHLDSSTLIEPCTGKERLTELRKALANICPPKLRPTRGRKQQPCNIEPIYNSACAAAIHGKTCACRLPTASEKIDSSTHSCRLSTCSRASCVHMRCPPGPRLCGKTSGCRLSDDSGIGSQCSSTHSPCSPTHSCRSSTHSRCSSTYSRCSSTLCCCSSTYSRCSNTQSHPCCSTASTCCSSKHTCCSSAQICCSCIHTCSDKMCDHPQLVPVQEVGNDGEGDEDDHNTKLKFVQASPTEHEESSSGEYCA
ncbi:hypothetical protein ScPMuIL_004536 [Solemya velum]